MEFQTAWVRPAIGKCVIKVFPPTQHQATPKLDVFFFFLGEEWVGEGLGPSRCRAFPALCLSWLLVCLLHLVLQVL